MNKKYIIGIVVLLAIAAGTTAYFTSNKKASSILPINKSEPEKLCVNSKGEWNNGYKECTWAEESNRIFQLALMDKEYCLDQGWRWSEGTCGDKMRCADHCEGVGGIAKRKCQEIGGQFDECASPCRHSGGGICIQSCDEVCTLK